MFCFLNVAAIKRDFDLLKKVENISFFSERSRSEFGRIVESNRDPVRITKPRVYSVKTPLSAEGIAPIFGIANIWEAFFIDRST